MAKKRPKIDLTPAAPPHRGELEKLFTTDEDVEQSAGLHLLAVRVDAIIADPFQPRRSMDDAALEELSESIKQDGVIQPIEVTEIAPGRYRLVHGERRWRATQMAGLATIPAIVRRSDYDAMTRFVRQLVENIQREDLNDVDRAAGLLRLRELMQAELEVQLEAGLSSGGPHSRRVSWARVGERLGYSRQRIHQLIQLLKLPEEIKDAVRQGALSERETRVYQGLTPRQQRDLFRSSARQTLNDREVRQVARQLKELPDSSVQQAILSLRDVPPPATTIAPSTQVVLGRIAWAQRHLEQVPWASLNQSQRAEVTEQLLELQAYVSSLLGALSDEAA